MSTPQQKLKTKTCTGAKGTNTYDEAATPIRRLLRDHPTVLTDHDRDYLQGQLDGME